MALEATQPDSIMNRILEIGAGIVGGAFMTLITLRTKLAMLDRDNRELKRELKEQNVKTENRLSRMERRESMMLRMLADISQKLGTDQRFSDSMIDILMDHDGHEKRES